MGQNFVILYFVTSKGSKNPFEFSTDLESLQDNYGMGYDYGEVSVKINQKSMRVYTDDKST